MRSAFHILSLINVFTCESLKTHMDINMQIVLKFCKKELKICNYTLCLQYDNVQSQFHYFMCLLVYTIMSYLGSSPTINSNILQSLRNLIS